jgi:cytochrome c oxidase subunit 2
VIGHQWWWEFRYPQYGVVTANELYLPAGRTVNFQLNSRDVIHSFWAPQLGGKRDVIANRTNYIWYTPDSSLAGSVFNGFCAEYCGSSHANMRFHVYTVAPADFESWAAHQKEAAATSSTVGYVFPLEKMPAHTLPQTPLPEGDREVKFDDALLAQGDAARGHELVTNMAHMAEVPCLTCHIIKGEYTTGGQQMLKDDAARGPNLTHFGTRHTFAGGIFVSDPKTLARWVKNAEHMKPGSLMTTLGAGQYWPSMKQTRTTGLDDRQIADIVAYLMALK